VVQNAILLESPLTTDIARICQSCSVKVQQFTIKVKKKKSFAKNRDFNGPTTKLPLVVAVTLGHEEFKSE